MLKKTIMAVLAISGFTTLSAVAGDRWTPGFGISGGGVSNCGETRVISETWNTCAAKAHDAELVTGVPVSVVNINYTNYEHSERQNILTRVRDCDFSAIGYCLFRTP